MTAFLPVTDAALAQARRDPAFRQKLLAQSLETLLAGIKRHRGVGTPEGPNARQLREGVELAVRLAELIQNASGGTLPP
jgi:hypothetical protein